MVGSNGEATDITRVVGRYKRVDTGAESRFSATLRLVLPNRIGNWSLTSLRQRLVKTGARLVKHARYYWLMVAESHLTRRLLGATVGRIAALPVPTG
ncbi:MAG: hypothetical protein WB763_05375 [Terriglobia bacterium]|jgi:hypothetical protein